MTEKRIVAERDRIPASSPGPRNDLVLRCGILLLPPPDLAPHPADDLRIDAVLPVGSYHDVQVAGRLHVKVVSQLHGHHSHLLRGNLQGLLLRIRLCCSIVQLLQLPDELVRVDAELLELPLLALKEGDDLQRETDDLRKRQAHVLGYLRPLRGMVDIPSVAS